MLDEEMEKAVFDWIGVMRASTLCVSRRMIKAKAKDTSTEEGFKASNGWLQRFMMRNGLSLRRKTTVCQRPPADSIPKLPYPLDQTPLSSSSPSRIVASAN